MAVERSRFVIIPAEASLGWWLCGVLLILVGILTALRMLPLEWGLLIITLAAHRL